MQSLDSEHSSGVWDWDDNTKELFFTSTKLVEDTGAGAEQQVRRQVPGCTHAYLDLTFNPAPDIVAFRRTCRRDRTLGPDVVTLRDVKDAVLFSVSTPLPVKIVDLLHTAQADRLLRAIIVYMQLYLQMSVELVAREDIVTREGSTVMRVLTYGPTVRAEGRMLGDLAVLRSVVGREYCSLLLGFGEMRKYHHMFNKLRRSTPEDDMRTHELLHQLAAQIAWVALGRRAQTQPLVSVELGRMLRSTAFNMAEHRNPNPPLSEIKQAVLQGPLDPYGARRKLLVRSVATLNLIALEDYEVAGLGYLDVASPSPRARFLELALTAPEETLLTPDVCVNVGVLGHPLADYDDMINLVKFTDDTVEAYPPSDKPKTLEPRRSITSESLDEGEEDEGSITSTEHGEGEEQHGSATEARVRTASEELQDLLAASQECQEAGAGEQKETPVEVQASQRELRPSPGDKASGVVEERQGTPTTRKNMEMSTTRGPIPPPGQFPSRKSGIPRGSPDLLEARAVWRRFNTRKSG